MLRTYLVYFTTSDALVERTSRVVLAVDCLLDENAIELLLLERARQSIAVEAGQAPNQVHINGFHLLSDNN